MRTATIFISSSLPISTIYPAFFVLLFFFFNDTATTEIYTLSLHDALPISINGNTDFLELYLNFEKRMYFSNNIPHEKGYSNSSFQINKKLPYSSTVVWPIRKLVYVQDKKADELLNQEQDIIGYLCVDSARRNVFQEGYDFEMGAIIADALFVFLKGYHTYLNKVG